MSGEPSRDNVVRQFLFAPGQYDAVGTEDQMTRSEDASARDAYELPELRMNRRFAAFELHLKCAVRGEAGDVILKAEPGVSRAATNRCCTRDTRDCSDWSSPRTSGEDARAWDGRAAWRERDRCAASASVSPPPSVRCGKASLCLPARSPSCGSKRTRQRTALRAVRRAPSQSYRDRDRRREARGQPVRRNGRRAA